jgi:hypothetical protein
MTLETDLNVSPYFDDYNESKDFYKPFQKNSEMAKRFFWWHHFIIISKQKAGLHIK